MDRLDLKQVIFYNPIKADLKIIEITTFICKNICRESDNELKQFTAEFIMILSCFEENYDHVVSLSNSVADIYEIFTENTFKILLEMKPNDSIKEINEFLQLISSIMPKYSPTFLMLDDTICKIDEMIEGRIDLIKSLIVTCTDNLQLNTCFKNFQLFFKIIQLLRDIYFEFERIKEVYFKVPCLNKQTKYYYSELKYFYENNRTNIPDTRKSISIKMNNAKSLFLELQKPLENMNI